MAKTKDSWKKLGLEIAKKPLYQWPIMTQTHNWVIRAKALRRAERKPEEAKP